MQAGKHCWQPPGGRVPASENAIPRSWQRANNATSRRPTRGAAVVFGSGQRARRSIARHSAARRSSTQPRVISSRGSLAVRPATPVPETGCSQSDSRSDDLAVFRLESFPFVNPPRRAAESLACAAVCPRRTPSEKRAGGRIVFFSSKKFATSSGQATAPAPSAGEADNHLYQG